MKEGEKRQERSFVVVAPEDWTGVAHGLLDFAGTDRKFLLYGEVGAGKTTLVQTICRQLGVADIVQSPTFSLINEYHSNTLGEPVFHADLYRLRNIEEALDAGLLEYFDSPYYTFVEWPEILEPLVAAESIQIWISLEDNSTRKVVILRPDGGLAYTESNKSKDA